MRTVRGKCCTRNIVSDNIPLSSAFFPSFRNERSRNSQYWQRSTGDSRNKWVGLWALLSSGGGGYETLIGCLAKGSSVLQTGVIMHELGGSCMCCVHVGKYPTRDQPSWHKQTLYNIYNNVWWIAPAITCITNKHSIPIINSHSKKKFKADWLPLWTDKTKHTANVRACTHALTYTHTKAITPSASSLPSTSRRAGTPLQYRYKQANYVRPSPIKTRSLLRWASWCYYAPAMPHARNQTSDATSACNTASRRFFTETVIGRYCSSEPWYSDFDRGFSSLAPHHRTSSAHLRPQHHSNPETRTPAQRGRRRPGQSAFTCVKYKSFSVVTWTSSSITLNRCKFLLLLSHSWLKINS